MTNNKPKSLDGLMKHLRNNGIEISGGCQKRQLMNTGYYHGYKGYRFFRTAYYRLPFSSYAEIYATIQYDTEIKSILYSRMMFIETALKNITLITIMDNIKSDNIYDVYEKAVNSYNNSPDSLSPESKRKLQINKLNLQTMIHNAISRAYRKNNPKISHFYNNEKYKYVPLWAIFEILTMGDFGYLLSCLTYEIRDKISRVIGINLSCDTKRELIYKYVYALKDLRNAIAHNDVVYDVRFKNIDPTPSMKRCLILETSLPYFNFNTVGDYVALMSYFLKLLKVTKTEIKSFIKEFQKSTEKYKDSVNSKVIDIVIHPELNARMEQLKKFL